MSRKMQATKVSPFKLLLLICILAPCLCHAQDVQRKNDNRSLPGEEKNFRIEEENASFWGCDSLFMVWMSRNIKYPTECVEHGVQGCVVAQFYVDPSGRVTDIKILQSPDPKMGKAVCSLLYKSPRWKPGRQRGKPVKCKFTMPYMFRLK